MTKIAILASMVGLLAGAVAPQVEAPPAPPISLHAAWGKILHSSHRRHEKELRDALPEGPAVPAKAYGWDSFTSLLPGSETNVGDTFKLDFAALRPFLAQIHPRIREKSHMTWLAYPGAHAVLLERTARRIDVLLRVHAEFELVPGKVFFTVSQFEGRLLVDPVKRRVIGFRLAVPARSYNYDVHIREGRRTLIDIGYLEELGVSGGWLPDAGAMAARLRQARIKLRRAFYPFARLDWMDFARGLHEARRQHKPLHLVTIFGQLDDESC